MENDNISQATIPPEYRLVINEPSLVKENSTIQYEYPSKSEPICLTLWISLLQIVITGLLIFFIIDIIKLKLLASSVLFFPLYIISFFVIPHTPIFKYLSNQVTNKTIEQIMKEYFKAYPVIKIKTESYHFVTTGTGRYQTTKKVVTSLHSEEIPYYSFKDVSGLFKLDIPKYKIVKYIKLQIINDIDFADDISYVDYLIKKVYIYLTNKDKDVCFDWNETREYANYVRYNLIVFKGEECWFFQPLIYIIFVILTLGWFYELIFLFFSTGQNFTVKKIISTRYNLLDDDHSTQFSSLQPTLSINSTLTKIDTLESGIIFEGNKKEPPTEEELTRAKTLKENCIRRLTTNKKGKMKRNNTNIKHSIPFCEYMSNLKVREKDNSRCMLNSINVSILHKNSQSQEKTIINNDSNKMNIKENVPLSKEERDV